MANFDFDLGLLEHQLHLARQNAIQTELAAAGLQEVGHPMLMCILRTAGARGADGLTQRELAQLLHVSPRRGGHLAEVPGEKGLHQPGAGARRRQTQPGHPDRQGPAGGG